MPNAQAQFILRHVRSILATHDVDRLTDRDLLQRFAQRRDEAAFTALVRRHGPMVLGVCRRVLANPHDADDAFQAAFFTLARQAGRRAWQESVAPWLHLVAHRLALKVKAAAELRARHESQATARPPDDPLSAVTGRELCGVLDSELSALPERLRAPLVLCCLEGQTRDEAARRLGLSLASLKRRLEQGRDRLRERLQRRGFALPAALAGVLVAEGVSRAMVPAALAQNVVIAAVSGSATSARVLALAQALQHGAFFSPLRAASLILVAVSVIGGIGLSVGARQSAEESQPKAKSREPKAEPLPDGAVLRLDTLERRAVGAKLGISADGKSIIGVRAAKYVSIWEANSGKLRETRELATGSRGLWVLSPDGSRLVTDGVPNGQLTVWDVRSGKPARTLAIKGAHHCIPVAFAQDSKSLATLGHVGNERSLRVWDLATGKETFNKGLGTNTWSDQLALTPDGKRLLCSFSSDQEGTICWGIATGQQLWQNKKFQPISMVISPDGKIFSSMTKFSALDLATGQPVHLEKPPPVSSLGDTRLALTPDGRVLLISTPQGVIVWDLAEGKQVRRLTGGGEEVVVAPDSKSVITNNGSLQRWDLATGQPQWVDNYDAGHIGEVTSLVLSADGKRLASASADGTVRFWDVKTGKPLHVWRGHEARRPVSGWEKAGVTSLDMTPDDRWVLSAGSEGQVRLRDAATGKEVQGFSLPARDRGEDELRVFHLRITPDGTKAVALFGAEGFFAVGPGADPPAKHTYKLATWDLSNGRLVGWHPIEIQPAKASGISPDGRTLLSKGVLIDVRTGQEFLRLQGFRQDETGEPLAFSGDGFLVVGTVTEERNKDGLFSAAAIRVWETATGKLITTLKTKPWVNQVGIHPNNRYVVTNDNDGVQLWDMVTGKRVAGHRMHEQVQSNTSGTYAGCIAFAPDGRLATGHPDGTILLWNMPLPKSEAGPLAAGELEKLWTDLADADAAKAWRAVWRLSDLPAAALPLLRAHLKPAAPAPADVMQRLLADLDNDAFERRQDAVDQLKELRHRAAPALREALAANPSAEKKRRIDELLKALAQPQPPTPETLRDLRAVIVLERIGDQSAREVLAALAKGVPDAPLTRAAKAALGRLAPITNLQK